MRFIGASAKNGPHSSSRNLFLSYPICQPCFYFLKLYKSTIVNSTLKLVSGRTREWQKAWQSFITTSLISDNMKDNPQALVIRSVTKGKQKKKGQSLLYRSIYMKKVDCNLLSRAHLAFAHTFFSSLFYDLPPTHQLEGLVHLVTSFFNEASFFFFRFQWCSLSWTSISSLIQLPKRVSAASDSDPKAFLKLTALLAEVDEAVLYANDQRSKRV